MVVLGLWIASPGLSDLVGFSFPSRRDLTLRRTSEKKAEAGKGVPGKRHDARASLGSLGTPAWEEVILTE